ncbi:MAG: hypothetical protein AAGI66_06245 [Cyanobacteria bacterium P01_H01_bin.74]
MRLEAVKIFKLEEFKAGGSKTAKDYGFDDDDPGEFTIDRYEINEDDDEYGNTDPYDNHGEADDDDEDDDF